MIRHTAALTLLALCLALAGPAPAANGDLSLRTVEPIVYVGGPGVERSLDPDAIYTASGTVTVRTSALGRARLTWPDGAACLLEPRTEAIAGVETLVVRKGETWLRFRKRNSAFRLLTPTATLGIRGTAFRVEVNDAGDTLVDLVEGRLAVETGGRAFILEAGQTLRATADGAAAVAKLPADAAGRFALTAPAFDAPSPASLGATAAQAAPTAATAATAAAAVKAAPARSPGLDVRDLKERLKRGARNR